jgi:glycosyltransferase involved in cell wall biosynthesis
MPTILQIIPTLESGGAERTAVEMARAIVASGGRALVATRGGRMTADVEAAGGRVVRFPVHSKNPFEIAANGRRLARLIREEHVDLVDVRSRAPAWSALLATRETHTPLVATYHGAYSATNPLKRWYNSGMVRADLVIANSEFTASSIRAQYAQRRDKIVVIPRGADFNIFDPAKLSADRLNGLRAKWGLAPPSPQTFTMLLPARLTGWKGHGVALEALAIVAERERGRTATGQRRDLQLVFAGDDNGKSGFVAQLRQEIAARGVGNMVRLVGHCADMPAAFALSDAVLSPSTLPEAFGRVAVEAAAMERPVVGSDHGGQRETIVDGETGFLIAPGDAIGIADAIDQLLIMAPFERRQMGRTARERALKLYSVKSMCDATLAAYRTLLAA